MVTRKDTLVTDTRRVFQNMISRKGERNLKSILKTLITMLLVIAIATSPVLSNPVNAANRANYVITTNANLYIRNGPGTNYKAKGKVAGGALVYVSNISRGNWGYLPEAGGYICLDYAKPVTFLGNGSEILKIYTNSGLKVNMRKGPGTKFAKIVGLSRGTRVYVTYRYGSWSWCSCTVSGKTYKGWVSSQYIKWYV